MTSLSKLLYKNTNPVFLHEYTHEFSFKHVRISKDVLILFRSTARRKLARQAQPIDPVLLELACDTDASLW